MSISPSIKSVKNVSATKSVKTGPHEISKKGESFLKLTKYEEKEKLLENKERSNKEKSEFDKFRSETRNNQSVIEKSAYSKKKITTENSIKKKEKAKNKVVRGEKLPIPPNPLYQNNDNDHKSIVCWNCDGVLLVGDDWDIVQCTNCEKLNKVPYDSPGKNKLYPSKLDNNYNHFETYIPYIFVITICPYCGKQNKVHKGTQHMICYKCNHSTNIESDISSGNKIKFHTGASTLSSNNSNTIKFSDIIPNNPMTQGVYHPGFVYPSNIANPPIDYYFNPYLYGNYGNIYPTPVLQNYLFNPYPARNYMLDYYLRKRMERNDPNDENNTHENLYEDKEKKNQISKLKENLSKINNDLVITDNKPSLNKNINEIKDQMENNKSTKNEAIYKSLLMK